MGIVKLKTLDDLPVDGRTVLLRLDYNVSIGKDKVVSEFEDYRIKSTLPTIEELIRRRCKIILLVRHGRPEENPLDADITPIHHRLEQLLGEEIRQAKRLYGDEISAIIGGLAPGGMVMTPNVRTDARELSESKQFAQELARTADVFVNEAFGEFHRNRASITILPQLLQSAAGRRVELEIKELNKLKNSPEHPYIAIVSGAKIATKLNLLRKIAESADVLFMGGQLANVLLTAQGKHPGKFNNEDIKAAQILLQEAHETIKLPVDVVVGNESGNQNKIVSIDKVPGDVVGLWDIGPKSVQQIIDQCKKAKTVMWNGPVGRFEVAPYAKSTNALANGIANISAHTVVGGGDTVVALAHQKLISKFDHVSVGGGAMLAYLEGEQLPGLSPLLTNS